MKMLLLGDFSNGALGLSYSRAFQKVGCEVEPFDYKVEYEAISRLAKNRYLSRLLKTYFDSILNKKLMKAVKALNPDLVFVIKGWSVFPETLREIKESSRALLFNFNPDNPFNLNRGASSNNIRNAIPIYDCYFIWGKFLIPDLMKVGARRVEYLPFACDPDLHCPVTISDEERKIYGSDVALIGTWEQEREKWLEPLADFDLAIWGNLWEKTKAGLPLKRKWKGRAAIGVEFSKVCVASKIVLNLIRKQNGDAHNMRTFEVPACRGFILTTRTKEQLEFFEEGKEIACFETPEELRMRLNQYLPDEGQRRKISAAAYEKAQAHTYSERVKTILDIYSKMRSSP